MNSPGLEPEKVAARFDGLGWNRRQRRRLARLACMLAELPPPPDPLKRLGAFARLQENLQEVLRYGRAVEAEEALLRLYELLHGIEAPYSTPERRVVDATGGYWCHAGGLSPLVRAEPFIRRETVSVDLGAGNGLQGLLLQKLSPHRLAVQVEISSAAMAEGRALQRWLGIPAQAVSWIHADLATLAFPEAGFVYLYRPLKPSGAGDGFYHRLSDHLGDQKVPPVVFSIADCLGPYLPDSFVKFYTDGQLTCYRRRDWSPGCKGS
ncbi:MAG: hypothetical protein D6806_10485 [Deltaproteobacteria bacterium]|nr:MAG: hypothetical protein D6806_10485 [Deltaproteobacteria bacterium]